MIKDFKQISLALLMWAAVPVATMAQVVDEDVLDEEEEQEIVVSQDTTLISSEDFALPEGMTQSETDRMLQDWYVRNFISTNEDCDPNAGSPEFTKEDYIGRLQRLPNVIEMPYNDIVRHYIDQYTGRLRRTVSVMLGASNFYTPIFEEALETYGIPLELKYLPVIESALNPGATSRVGAAGLWQFMVTTGKRYGMEVTSLVDERRDPIKASYAAAHYLKDLYGIFGDWTLVIAAYNCGPANVNKAIKRAGGEKDFWKIYPYLPNETRGYVPGFIAANYVMTYYCEHNICPVNMQLPTATDTIMIHQDLKMEQVQDLCGVSIEELKALNPQYRTTLIPGSARPSTLRMSQQAISTFLELGDSVYNHRAGELFARREAEVSMAEPVKQTSNTQSSRKSRGSQSVTIRKGDSLGAIARRNGTTVAKLRALNGIRGNNIRAGKKIRVR